VTPAPPIDFAAPRTLRTPRAPTFSDRSRMVPQPSTSPLIAKRNAGKQISGTFWPAPPCSSGVSVSFPFVGETVARGLRSRRGACLPSILRVDFTRLHDAVDLWSVPSSSRMRGWYDAPVAPGYPDLVELLSSPGNFPKSRMLRHRHEHDREAAQMGGVLLGRCAGRRNYRQPRDRLVFRLSE